MESDVNQTKKDKRMVSASIEKSIRTKTYIYKQWEELQKCIKPWALYIYINRVVMNHKTKLSKSDSKLNLDLWTSKASMLICIQFVQNIPADF